MSVPVYWKGHDRKTDEKLAKTLFHGQTSRDPVTKRFRKKYLSHGSAGEREALCALSRLLGHKFYVLHREKNPIMDDGILDLVMLALNPDKSAAHPAEPKMPQLVPKFADRGNRSDTTADLQVAMHVATLTHDEKWPTEAAVENAVKKFGVSRKAVFAAKSRVRKRFAKFGIEFPA